jgi:hypothetical protein
VQPYHSIYVRLLSRCGADRRDPVNILNQFADETPFPVNRQLFESMESHIWAKLIFSIEAVPGKGLKALAHVEFYMQYSAVYRGVSLSCTHSKRKKENCNRAEYTNRN